MSYESLGKIIGGMKRSEGVRVRMGQEGQKGLGGVRRV